jgi:hypothetical protein
MPIIIVGLFVSICQLFHFVMLFIVILRCAYLTLNIYLTYALNTEKMEERKDG